MAIARNPASEKNRYYRVQIYKRLNQIDKAVADCRIIVEKNPHHVDALREIRGTPGQLRLRKHTGQVEKTHELRTLRKDIARLETVLTEKKAKAPAAA